jgi:hypothetical protein
LRPATLVRSEAFSTGWQASARDMTSGRTMTVPVRRLGLIEAVRLSPGTYTVTWTYRPQSVTAGLLASLAGILVIAAAAGSWWWRRRPRGRHDTPESTVSPEATPHESTANSEAVIRV